MKINKYLDHTALKADTSKFDIYKLIDEAKQYEFASVCVNPCWVEYASEKLKSTPVKVCTVIGFPLGASTTKTKIFEAQEALANGADEIDMVINVAALKNGEYDYVLNEIKSIKDVCGSNILKVIIETCLLTDDEKRKACNLVVEAGADFVKTSTGFGTGGATKEDIELFKEVVGSDCLIKASGGVRNIDDAQIMIEAGANRIGTSGSVAIVNGLENKSDY